MRLPSFHSPSNTRSEAFLKLFIQKHILRTKQTCWWSGWERRAHRNWEEPTFTLLASRLEPIGILDSLQSNTPASNHIHSSNRERYLSTEAIKHLSHSYTDGRGCHAESRRAHQEQCGRVYLDMWLRGAVLSCMSNQQTSDHWTTGSASWATAGPPK